MIKRLAALLAAVVATLAIVAPVRAQNLDVVRLTLNPSTGVLSGTPTASGTFTFDVVASNIVGSSPPHHVTVEVLPALTSTGCWFWSDPCGL